MDTVYNVIGSDPYTVPTVPQNDLVVVQPPFHWRLLHCTLCIVGGTTFLLGSIQYLPYFSHEAKGAYLFTVGSFTFFIADLLDFASHHRFGSFTRKNDYYYESSSIQWFFREEDALNSVLMTTGSLSYFIGCVYFIPSLGHTDIGDILFIPGSIMLFVAEVWRIYRAGSTQYNSTTGCSERCNFSSRNITNKSAFRADLSLCLGAVAFLVGSMLFLPSLDITEVDTRRAAAVFILGSALFLLSALFLFYDYFVVQRT